MVELQFYSGSSRTCRGKCRLDCSVMLPEAEMLNKNTQAADWRAQNSPNLLASHTQPRWRDLSLRTFQLRQRRQSTTCHADKVRCCFPLGLILQIQIAASIAVSEINWPRSKFGKLTSIAVPDGCPQVRGRDPEEEAVRRDSLPAACPLLGGENSPTPNFDPLKHPAGCCSCAMP